MSFLFIDTIAYSNNSVPNARMTSNLFNMIGILNTNLDNSYLLIVAQHLQSSSFELKGKKVDIYSFIIKKNAFIIHTSSSGSNVNKTLHLNDDKLNTIDDLLSTKSATLRYPNNSLCCLIAIRNVIFL